MNNRRITLTISLLSISLLLMSGCATLQKPAESWDDLFSTIPGEDKGSGYPEKAAKWKYFPFSIESGSSQISSVESRFSATCQHLGGTVATPQNTGSAQEFLKAIAALRNWEGASYGTLSYSRNMACVDQKARTISAALIFYQNRGSRYSPLPSKDWPMPTVAFYRTDNISDFVAYYMAEETKRVEKAMEDLRQKSEREKERTRQLRTSPKVGDETSKGIIVELRPPLALIQYHKGFREILDLPPSEWVPINSLTAPSNRP